jgi:hypothetical protein
MKLGQNLLKLIIMFLFLEIPVFMFAQGNLTGNWKYSSPEGEMKMQITGNTMIIGEESYSYKVENNNLQVYDGNSYTTYPFMLNGNQLTLIFPGGSKIMFNRESAGPAEKDILLQSLKKSETMSSPDSKSSSLSGKWFCQTPEGELLLEFLSSSQLVFNGETTQYQLQEGIIQAMGENGWINYPYQFDQGKLIITFPDGARIEFARASSSIAGQAAAGMQSQGGTLVWQLNGSLCFWAGSSGSSSSYSRSEKLYFDGKGNFTFGNESSFSGDAGIAYSGNPNLQRGTYRVEQKFVMLQFQTGEIIQAEINMRQDNGRITELMHKGKLYATSLCDQ